MRDFAHLIRVFEAVRQVQNAIDIDAARAREGHNHTEIGQTRNSSVERIMHRERANSLKTICNCHRMWLRHAHFAISTATIVIAILVLFVILFVFLILIIDFKAVIIIALNVFILLVLLLVEKDTTLDFRQSVAIQLSEFAPVFAVFAASPALHTSPLLFLYIRCLRLFRRRRRRVRRRVRIPGRRHALSLLTHSLRLYKFHEVQHAILRVDAIG